MAASITTAAVTVGTTATAIADTPSAAGGGTTVVVFHGGTNDIFLGGSDVTTANGMPLAAGEKMTFYLRPGQALYGRVASGTEALRRLTVQN